MPVPVTRTPVDERMPWCYTLHRGDNDPSCAACAHQGACSNAKASNLQRVTVAEAAAAAVAAYRSSIGIVQPQVEDLIRQAAEQCGVSATVLRFWLTDREWITAFTTVLAACQVAGWDARNYVKAISTTVGVYTVGKNWRMMPGMYSGAKAVERFFRWADRNQRIYGHADGDRRRIEEERESLIAGECCFAERYLASGASIADCEEWARENFPMWSLAQTAARDDLRLPALSSAVASLNPSLPHRLLVPAGEWGWPDARAAVLALTDFEDGAPDETLELDPDLGDLL